MKATTVLLTALLAFAALPAQGEEKPLFNGRDLTGWEGDKTVWRVRDGVIVGGHLEGNPRNEFLATAGRYGDFVLRFEYRIDAPGPYNAGVQFRSERISDPPHEMKGYQADIGPGISGGLYDESRRRKFLARPTAEQVSRLEKHGQWNRYEVRCEGPRIRLFLNGELTVDFSEPDPAIPQTGRIALQVHGGAAQECCYRNITIEELPHGTH